MRGIIKKKFRVLPDWVKVSLVRSVEFFYFLISVYKEHKHYPNLKKSSRRPGSRKIKNVLIYHISGMFYAGTEKNLQLIANELASDYTVCFMYSKDNFSERQKEQMDKRIELIEFSYDSVEQKHPNFIRGMSPHIKEIISKKEIDLLITSSSGHAHYPINTIRDIPIILINIFGSPSLQKNIISTIFISKTIQDYSETFTGKRKTNSWAHLPVKTSTRDRDEIRKRIRQRFNIPDSAFVFGRIGRKSDHIFDPIGIRAFKNIVAKYPEAHYLIMSPPPILEKIVTEEKIPNVHFMSDKEDIWDFYYALDALAHFRLDGETFGLNIAEAMYAENPIISHVSSIWNAHLEYLGPTFSRVAELNNVDQYTAFMEEFILMRKSDPEAWNAMRRAAKQYATDHFNEKVYGQNVKNIIQSLS